MVVASEGEKAHISNGTNDPEILQAMKERVHVCINFIIFCASWTGARVHGHGCFTINQVRSLAAARTNLVGLAHAQGSSYSTGSKNFGTDVRTHS